MMYNINIIKVRGCVMICANEKYSQGQGSLSAGMVIHKILSDFKKDVRYTGGVTLRFHDWVDFVHMEYSKDADNANHLVLYMYKNFVYRPTEEDLLWLGNNNFTCVLNIAREMRIDLPSKMSYALDTKKIADRNALFDILDKAHKEAVFASQRAYAKGKFSTVLEQLVA